jgi:hypothetical protein
VAQEPKKRIELFPEKSWGKVITLFNISDRILRFKSAAAKRSENWNQFPNGLGENKPWRRGQTMTICASMLCPHNILMSCWQEAETVAKSKASSSDSRVNQV